MTEQPVRVERSGAVTTVYLHRPTRRNAVDGPTAAALAAAFRAFDADPEAAAAAHGEHEERTGQPDPDWPDWYAEYLVREQAGEGLPT